MNIEFFEMVAQASFLNPFSSQRIELDRQIVGAAPESEWDELLPQLQHELTSRIAEISDIKKVIAQREADEDARAVSLSLLFQLFHEYTPAFDTLIEEQIKAGPESCQAPFAQECLERLTGCGFRRSDAARYVAIFYQMRRAFYFISRTLVGSSDCMRALRERLWQNLFTCRTDWYEGFLWNCMEDFSTLLLGETGTGKGAVAAAIGRSGFIPYNPRTRQFEASFAEIFIPINLSQFSETLIESELFGHRKGAFTGAVERHEGVFARCSEYGSIFLDEIGEVSLPVQIKLLKVLQERIFSPVGGHETQRFSGRIIAATNRSIKELRATGAMRDDFYYRLCSDEITVPPLRQRIAEDSKELELLTGHILSRLCARNATALKDPVLQNLKQSTGKNYRWPGNVRELEQAVRRILLTGTYTPQTLNPMELTKQMQQGTLTAKELTARYCRELYDQLGNYGEVARRLDLDWRTVKKYVAE